MGPPVFPPPLWTLFRAFCEFPGPTFEGPGILPRIHNSPAISVPLPMPGIRKGEGRLEPVGPPDGLPEFALITGRPILSRGTLCRVHWEETGNCWIQIAPTVRQISQPVIILSVQTWSWAFGQSSPLPHTSGSNVGKKLRFFFGILMERRK